MIFSPVMGVLHHKLLIVLISLFALLLAPPAFWISFMRNFGETYDKFVWRDFIESTTLYYILDIIINMFAKNSTVHRPSLVEPNSIKAPDTTTQMFYHRIINEVVRLHKSQSEVAARSYRQRFTDGHEQLSSEKIEALHALQAADVLQSAGHHTKAKKLLEHAFHLDSDNINVLVALGEAIEASWRSLKAVRPKLEANGHKPSSSSLAKLPEFEITEVDELLLSADHLYTRALIFDPHFSQAYRSKGRLMPLVEEIDQRRFNIIDFKVRRFYQIPETNPGLRHAKLEHYFKHIYHSNAIEGNTLTLAQTRSILETRLAVGGKSLMEQNEVLGLDAALRYINSTLMRGKSTPISLDIILNLHRHILSFVDPSEAGHLRRTQVFIADHQPPPPEAVPSLMVQLVSWLNSDQLTDVHPIEVAALIHWKLVYIHPFYDGNGRTARLLMNLILMRAGLPPAIIKIEDRPAYYEHLKTANDGDVRPFVRFVATCTERTVDEYLDAALEKPKIMTNDGELIPSEPPSTVSNDSPTQCLQPSQQGDKLERAFSEQTVLQQRPAAFLRWSSSHVELDFDNKPNIPLPSVIYLGG
ncbi:Adenosine monophosphate-protein transferase FICD [Paragonimus heterotremus]|uniref:protein adenylyltransferase n=1 Tax=Paragonimus heterotremus TaxID=100268 RepID=A0A8J4SQA1_9TREM|nr:Adenosine monophosphate-protein transferase FICD [Paragonimus heterotremus]